MCSFPGKLPRGKYDFTVSKQSNENIKCYLCDIDSNISYILTIEMFIKKTDINPDITHTVKLCSEECISSYIQNIKNKSTNCVQKNDYNIIRI